MRCSSQITALVGLVLAGACQAQTLEPIGPVYPIAETSALDMLVNKLQRMERTGELQRLQEHAVRRAMGSVTQMPPVSGVSAVTQRAQRWIDPTVTYAQAVSTDDGRIVVPAGTRVNPLELMSLTRSLVFFDGRDPHQREAVRRLVATQPGRIKPILIAGSWLDLTRSWKTQVYFDQQGSLSQRFGVRAVPSVIRQQGRLLLLEEIPAKELR